LFVLEKAKACDIVEALIVCVGATPRRDKKTRVVVIAGSSAAIENHI